MKKLKLTIIVTMFIAIITAISIYLNPDKNTTKSLEKKDFKSIDISPGEQVYTYNGYIYIYGKSGIKVIKGEKTLLEDKFSLENPYVVTSYNKLAIGDKNSKVIRVYSNEGHMYTQNTANNILGFTINKNGFLVVILKNDINYQIEIYNNSGENIYSIKDISFNEGVPIGVSISEDNKILSVSYIKTMGATVDSNIVFYSIEENNIFGGVVKQNQIVGVIKFMDNSNIVFISDKEIFVVKCSSAKTAEQVKEIYKKPLNNVLKDVSFLDGIGYVICYGQPIIKSEDSIEDNTIAFYNQSGGEIGKYYKKEKNITNIFSNKFGAILQDARLFTALDKSGKKLWEYQATQDIKDVIFYDSDNKALIVTNDKIKIVKIDKTLVDKQIDENTIEKEIDKKTEETTNNPQKEDKINLPDKNQHDKNKTPTDKKSQSQNPQSTEGQTISEPPNH
ncbi:DUF5711 family protein [uncultured Tyzzerella sp.]|uniref:DUF5711 family protein n=1 Tax=uncultured Tyzzerella sp. TaxID=2321398 RepID=UPI0029424534|nr:DUF5711 family protein [uncultured Tyzzerella sp.]